MEQLHYYCPSSTLLSILKNREIWLTALGLSNDKLEGIWALQRYLGLFKSDDRLRQRGARLDIERALRDRVALGMCFSEERDLLSQWRGYANNGRGVCMTFRTEALREATIAVSEHTPGLKLSKVSYGRIEERGLPKILYDAFHQGIEGYSESSDGIGRLSRGFPDGQHQRETDAISLLYEHKNPAFSEEKEWRLIVVQHANKLPSLEYREGRDLISPYIRVPMDRSAVEMVTLGPQHPTPPEVMEDFLKSLGCRAKVVTSQASYIAR